MAEEEIQVSQQNSPTSLLRGEACGEVHVVTKKYAEHQAIKEQLAGWRVSRVTLILLVNLRHIILLECVYYW